MSLRLPASGSSGQEDLSVSVSSSQGQPNQAFSQLAAAELLASGLEADGPSVRVWKMLQPPVSTGFLDARRVVMVAKSIASMRTLTPILRRFSAVTSAAGPLGWSVGCMTTTGSPL